MSGVVSLLHATWQRSSTPMEVRDAWLENSAHPEAVEYIFAMDADDDASICWTEGHLRVVSTPDIRVTTVRNWNAAAQLATGDLLVVIADDLFPPMHWDTLLWQLVRDLDPRRHPFGIKVTDSSNPRDTLMRHPVISRALFEANGLFDSRFRGVYCDNDITLTCFWNYSIIDGRELILEHRHPSADPSITHSKSQTRQNLSIEYAHGARILVDKWPAWKRRARIRLISIPESSQWHWCLVDRVSHELRCIERLLAPLRLAKRILAATTLPRRFRSLWASSLNHKNYRFE